MAKADTAAPSATRQVIRDATNKINFAAICIATAALVGAVMTRIFTGENPKDRPIISFRGSVASTRTVRRDVSPRFYLREIPMFQKHVQEHGGGIGGVLAGGKDMS